MKDCGLYIGMQLTENRRDATGASKMGPGVPTVNEYINNFSAFIMRLPRTSGMPPIASCYTINSCVAFIALL
jgi:hypothetical protein